MKVLRTASGKAFLAFLVVMLALIVAMWPRDDTETPPAASTPEDPASAAELVRAREQAALPPCPEPTGADAGASPLGGLTVPCPGDGTVVDLGPALAGRPAVLNFWAQWCQPCRKELPLFGDLAQRAGQDMTVLGVQAYQGMLPDYDALEFFRDLRVHLAFVTDADGKVAQAVNVQPTYPTTVFVRADGSIARVVPGEYRSQADLDRAVREYLGVDVPGSAP